MPGSASDRAAAGAVSASKALTRTVPASTTAGVLTLRRALKASTFALASGAGSITSGGVITLTSGLAAGASITFSIEESVGSGLTQLLVRYPVTMTGAYALIGLSVASSGSINAALPIIGTVPGSTLTSPDLPPGVALDSAGRTITLPSSAGTVPAFTLIETLAGATGSPRSTSVGSISVSAAFGFDSSSAWLFDATSFPSFDKA